MNIDINSGNDYQNTIAVENCIYGFNNGNENLNDMNAKYLP